MITLLIALVLIALVWYVLRRLVDPNDRLAVVIDVLFALVAIVVVARWAGIF
jgi:hypothetical protein